MSEKNDLPLDKRTIINRLLALELEGTSEKIDTSNSFNLFLGDSVCLTTKQVAEELGMSVVTLNKWRGKGEGPPSMKFGSSVRYKISDLIVWVDAQPTYRSTAEFSEEKRRKLKEGK